MKKLARGRKLFILFVLVVFAFIASRNLFSKNKNEDNNNDFQKELYQNVKDEKSILHNSSLKVKQITEAISSDVEIVVLKEIGSIELFHDKTPENNKYIEWLIDSNIYAKVYYTAILTIDTEDIQVIYNSASEEVDIVYNIQDIKVKSINIDDILLKSSKGVFGKEYVVHEMSELTLFATDKIKEIILNNQNIKHLASMNLEGTLTNLAYTFEVYDINIIQK